MNSSFFCPWVMNDAGGNCLFWSVAWGICVVVCYLRAFGSASCPYFADRFLVFFLSHTIGKSSNFGLGPRTITLCTTVVVTWSCNGVPVEKVKALWPLNQDPNRVYNARIFICIKYKLFYKFINWERLVKTMLSGSSNCLAVIVKS